MKLFIFRSLFLLTLILGYGNSYGQTSVSACSKKGTPDCPLIQNCPKKGTKDCPYAASFASQSTGAAMADCPLKGTPNCPLVQNFPKKGTADCPLVKKETAAVYAAKRTSGRKKAADADLPACCKKSS